MHVDKAIGVATLVPICPHRPLRLLAFGVIWLCIAASTGSSCAAASVPVPTAPASAQSGKTATTAGRLPLSPSAVARPRWTDLSSIQREALAPLAGHWDALSASQKRKWLALSKSYHTLPSSERARMHARMDDWVALTPQQRRTARLNFVETKRMTPDEKQEKWEAYQALTPAARSKFTQTAPRTPVGAATALQPAQPRKLTEIPVVGPDRAARPLIAAPDQLDPHTLLPQLHNGGGATSTRK